jgi:zinc protease
MLAQLRKTFGKFQGKAPKHPPMPEVPMPKAPRDIHVPMAREQVHVYLGHVGIRRTHPDYYALSVMDHVLGTGPGFTSRCSRKLRDEQGLCYAVSAGITASAGEEPGAFTAYIGTSPEHRQRAIDGFLAEIRRIREEPPTADELADVQAYLTGSFVFALERNANLAAYAIRARRFQLGFDYLHRYPEWIRSVTREQVQHVAAQHLHPEAMVCVSAGAS